jgi:hypothetical protein
MTGNLPRSVLDTTGLAPAKALAAWEENIGVMYDVQLPDRTPDAFFAKVEAFCLDTIMLGECRTVAQSYQRSRFPQWPRPDRLLCDPVPGAGCVDAAR